MKIDKTKIITTILFIVGISILFYPFVSDRWNEKRSKQVMQNANKNILKLEDTEIDKMRKDAQDYNRELVGSIVPDVFIIRDKEENQEYERLVNPCSNGIMGTIEIPAIKTKIPIYHYTTNEVLTKGAGHIFGSSLPVGGESTHAVISAHRGLPSAKMFTDLDLIKKGDTFYVDVLGDRLAYEVDKIEIVEPNDTRSLAIEKGEDYMTLVTCTPYGVNTKRLLVRGHRISYSKEVYVKEGEKTPSKWSRVGAKALCIIIGFLFAYMILKILDRNKKITVCDSDGTEKDDTQGK